MTARRAIPSLAACALVLAVVACRPRVVDVGAFNPVLVENGRVVELLAEADELAQRDPAAAARNLREIILPRARANAEAAGRLNASHPRAQALLRELVRVTGERVDTIEQYATAFERRDARLLHASIQRQRALDLANDRLEADVQAARNAPAERGC